MPLGRVMVTSTNSPQLFSLISFSPEINNSLFVTGIKIGVGWP